MDVLTFGETMISLRADRPLALNPNISATIAGAESTVAIGLARLGHSVEWAGRVGDDAGGELIRRTLRAESVGQDHVSIDPHRQTGILIFEQRLPDVTRVGYYRQNSAGSALSSDDLAPALAGRPHILHITGITAALGDSAAEAALKAASAAQADGATVTFDVNYRAKLWSREEAASALHALVPYVDVIIGSPDEVDLLTEGSPATPADSASELLRLGVREVVLKLGAGGAILHGRHGTVHSPARPVTAVDSVGAGDAFTAGYISGLLTGLMAKERLHLANTLGAFAVSSKGDWEGLPTRPELSLLDAADGTVLR